MAKPISTQTSVFTLEDINKLIPQRPSAFVLLPSKGLYYDPDVVKDGMVELCPMSAREEKLVAGMRDNSVDEVIDTILRRCLITKIDPDDLLTSDRFYLLLVLRANSYGENYNMDLVCPFCSTKAKYIAKVPSELAINYAEPDHNFLVELPISKLQVRYKFITGADQKAIKAYVTAQAKFTKGYDGDPAYMNTIARHVVSVNDKTAEISTLMHLFERLPAKDTAYFKDIYEESTPGVITTISKTCVYCTRVIETELPITAEFFRPKFSAKD